MMELLANYQQRLILRLRTTNINDKNYTKIYEKYSKLFMILAAVFFVTTVATTVIIVILTCKLCDQKRNNING